MSIAADVRDYVAAQVTSLPMITEDEFGPGSDGLMVRGDPSSAVVAEFIDGSYQGSQQLSFYARSKKRATAQGWLEAVRSVIDKKEITLTGLKVIRVRSASTVSFVSKEETGESIYVTVAVVDYDGQNPFGG